MGGPAMSETIPPGAEGLMSDAYREMLQANRAAVESFQRTMAGRSGSGIPDAVAGYG